MFYRINAEKVELIEDGKFGPYYKINWKSRLNLNVPANKMVYIYLPDEDNSDWSSDSNLCYIDSKYVNSFLKKQDKFKKRFNKNMLVVKEDILQTYRHAKYLEEKLK